MGFFGSSAGKESACNAGDPVSIPGSGRFAGEGIGYLLQYSWASLMAQPVKNLPAIWESWAQYLGREDLLKKGMATHSSIRAWRIPWTIPWGHRVRRNWATTTFIEWTNIRVFAKVFYLKTMGNFQVDVRLYVSICFPPLGLRTPWGWDALTTHRSREIISGKDLFLETITRREGCQQMEAAEEA